MDLLFCDTGHLDHDPQLVAFVEDISDRFDNLILASFFGLLRAVGNERPGLYAVGDLRFRGISFLQPFFYLPVFLLS